MSFYDFRTSSVRALSNAPREANDFTVSPDGRTFLYVKPKARSDIIMVDSRSNTSNP